MVCKSFRTYMLVLWRNDCSVTFAWNSQIKKCRSILFPLFHACCRCLEVLPCTNLKCNGVDIRDIRLEEQHAQIEKCIHFQSACHFQCLRPAMWNPTFSDFPQVKSQWWEGAVRFQVGIKVFACVSVVENLWKFEMQTCSENLTIDWQVASESRPCCESDGNGARSATPNFEIVLRYLTTCRSLVCHVEWFEDIHPLRLGTAVYIGTRTDKVRFGYCQTSNPKCLGNRHAHRDHGKYVFWLDTFQ